MWRLAGKILFKTSELKGHKDDKQHKTFKAIYTENIVWAYDGF